jgi:hypothetical protein
VAGAAVSKGLTEGAASSGFETAVAAEAPTALFDGYAAAVDAAGTGRRKYPTAVMARMMRSTAIMMSKRGEETGNAGLVPAIGAGPKGDLSGGICLNRTTH